MKRRRPPDRVRLAAVRILARWQREHRHVEELVERQDTVGENAVGGPWSYAERRRLRELVFSCVRLRGRYDDLINRRLRKAGKLAPEVRAVLWVALHELVELEHKDHAVVDEAVRSVVATGAGHARGFVNGLLRGLLRDGIRDGVPGPEDVVAHASTWLSHPEWLVTRWVRQLGPEATLDLCRANNERPRLYLRSLPGRRDELASELAAHEWEHTTAEEFPDAVELLTRVPPALLLRQVGEPCVFQDAAAQLVAPLLTETGPGRVLDLCSAPGGKTTHLASLLPEAGVVAADLGASRLRRMGPALERLGVAARVDRVVADGAHPPFAAESFDAVLVDAPCTGTGVLARRHDARWIREACDLPELAALQRVLLESALDLVRPGGVVLYATCSLEPEENDEVVDFILARREDVREWSLDGRVDGRFLRDGRLSTFPHEHGIDGAFAARLRKLESGEQT